MRLGRGGLILLVGMSAAPPASANFNLIGAGLASCGTWTQNRKRPTLDTKQIEQWMLGFLSGAGYIGAPKYDPLNGLDAPAVLAWVDNFCAANPLKSISDAGYSFIDTHPK